MPKPLLLVFAGTLIAFSPGLDSAQGQNAQEPAPAQSAPAAPAQAAPAPAQSVPAATPQAVAPPPANYPRNPIKPTAESQTKAKTLYGIDCAMCHGDNGNGKDKMPPEDSGRANDDLVWNLVIYIRGFSKSGRASASSAQN